jgi:hypothetical protein
MSTDVTHEIENLHRLKTGELADLYEELHGRPCRTRHRAYLIRKVAWRIQANAWGDLSQRARRRAAELADDAEVRVMAPRTMVCPPQPGSATRAIVAAPTANPDRDPRLPAPGSAIVRTYKGRKVRVIVLDDDQGFEHDGEKYRTLSAVAKQVTGSHLNGYRFFGLTKGGDQ